MGNYLPAQAKDSLGTPGSNAQQTTSSTKPSSASSNISVVGPNRKRILPGGDTPSGSLNIRNRSRSESVLPLSSNSEDFYPQGKQQPPVPKLALLQSLTDIMDLNWTSAHSTDHAMPVTSTIAAVDSVTQPDVLTSTHDTS